MSNGWNLPPGWREVQLGEVCFIDKHSLSSKTPKDYRFEYISLSDVDKGKLIGAQNYKLSEAPSRARRVVKQGDVLLATVRPNLQGFYIFREDIKDHIVSTGFAVLTPKDSSLDSEYLFQTLFTDRMRAVFNVLNIGSNYPAINSSDIRKIKIPLPSLSEQKTIGKILQTWDTAIEKTEALIVAKREQFKWLHSTTIRQSKHTKPTKFGDFLSESRIFDTENNPKKRLSVRLHLKGVEVRKFRGTESEDAVQYYRRKAGQLIYGKQNFSRGAIGIVPDELDGYSSSQDIPAFDVANTVNSKWLFWYLSRPNFYKKLGLLAAGSGSKRLHASELYKITVPLPLLPEQERITDTLDTHWQEIILLERLSDCYWKQKRGLMQKLLTGRWMVKK